MTIGVLTLEIHLPQSRSLKDKRQVLRSIKDRLRARQNVAVSEMEEHANVWQRAGLAIASIASDRNALDRLFEAVMREAESQVPGSVIETGRDFIEASDGGPGGWEGNYA